MKPIAIVYTCRNPGQTALLWAWQPPPFGHGWIDVKQEPLVRLSDVEGLVRAAYDDGFNYPGDMRDRENFIDELVITLRELLK